MYEEPHEGRAAVLAWLEKVRAYAPPDLQFVIEDVTGADDYAAGVQWHVEVGGGGATGSSTDSSASSSGSSGGGEAAPAVVFPFSRGCSFIRLNADGRIASVRDVVEPAAKPGDGALKLLGALTVRCSPFRHLSEG